MLSYYERITLVALRMALGKVGTIVHASHLFGWDLRAAKAYVEKMDNSIIYDGQLLYKMSGEGVTTFYLETGDRTMWLSSDGQALNPFFDNATVERRSGLIAAMAQISS